MHRIDDTLTQVQQRIHAAAMKAGRNADDITLLGVSKKQSVEKIAAVAALGLKHIGENYLQEALDKQAQLTEQALTWHFIGPVQSNKTRAIATHFDWVHSVDRLKIAERLANARADHDRPLNVCLQVNIDDEDSKSGCAPEEALSLAKALSQFDSLRLRGLMIIPKAQETLEQQRPAFAAARALRDDIASATGHPLDTLSMGMSADLEAAVAEGATIVRIGTALFGSRH